MIRLLLLVALLFAVGCGPDLAAPSDREVEARVADAEARLAANAGGQLVAQAIEAHGGLAAWYRTGPLRYRYAYTRLDSLGEPAGDALDTRQLVDTWSARAVHTLAADPSVSFGWTGAEAWVRPAGADVPTNPRFWALTPYYFVSMPFVFADPGVTLTLADPDSLEGRPVDVVHATFAAGTGDAPDDYYDLLLDPETHRVRGLRYVVSYAAFNPDGGHTPETLMIYDGEQTVGGVTLQEGFRSFLSATGQPKARGTVTEVASAPETLDAAFGTPADAEVQPEL